MPDAFYEHEGDLFVASELTRGPWDPGAQHAGPPAALIGRAIEQLPEAAEFEVGRITVEVLGPIPIGRVTVEARIARPGRRVQLVEAELSAEGKVQMCARAWRLRKAALELPADALVEGQAPTPPEQASPIDFFPVGQEHGYHTGMEYVSVFGGFVVPGPAAIWLRMLKPLVAGEDPSPLQRLMMVADVANGVSSTLDYGRFAFINLDISVHIERMPEGEWICVDAETFLQPSGRGTAESVLSDRKGRLARALQTLFIAER